MTSVLQGGGATPLFYLFCSGLYYHTIAVVQYSTDSAVASYDAPLVTWFSLVVVYSQIADLVQTCISYSQISLQSWRTT